MNNLQSKASKNSIRTGSLYHTLIFSTVDGRDLGRFNFSKPELTFEGDVDESGKIFVEYVCKAFNAKIQEDIKKAVAAERAKLLTTTYVQPVPDHCDRIMWRGRYFHLPVDQTAAIGEPVL